MAFISIVSVLIGIGIVVFLKHDAKTSMIKEAQREASHMNLRAIEIELENLNAEWTKFGVLSEKEKTFMDALHSRRIDLQRHAARTTH